jgi:hypothetical protein
MVKKQKMINNQEPVSIIISIIITMCFIIPFRVLFSNLIIHVNFHDFSSFSLFLTYQKNLHQPITSQAFIVTSYTCKILLLRSYSCVKNK